MPMENSLHCYISISSLGCREQAYPEGQVGIQAPMGSADVPLWACMLSKQGTAVQPNLKLNPTSSILPTQQLSGGKAELLHASIGLKFGACPWRRIRSCKAWLWAAQPLLCPKASSVMHTPGGSLAHWFPGTDWMSVKTEKIKITSCSLLSVGLHIYSH